MAHLSVRLLGGFQLSLDGKPLPAFATARMQALVAYLVLKPGAEVSRQHLAFLFWPDSNEAQARTNLRQLFHHLKSAWPDIGDFIEGDTQMLRWRADASYTVDTAQFEAATPEAAIDLYRGDFLPGLYDEWIETERQRLKLCFAEALESVVRQSEAARDYTRAIACAERLAALDPLRESVYRSLMRLNAANGDRAAALHVYERCASALQKELGVEPSAATRTARDRLSGEELHAHTPAEIPLIGRRQEWAQLRDRTRGLVAVTGEAGIGKTRLVRELIEFTSRQGASTAWTACYLSNAPMSWAPVAEWLRSPSIRPGLEGPQLSQLARVLPEILAEHPEVPAPPPFTETWQRRHFFEALARVVLKAPKPIVLAIDDLQWCDSETIEWLHYLLRLEAASQLLIVATVRIDETGKQHPAAVILRAMQRDDLAVEIPLGPLSASETAALAARVSKSEVEPGDAGRLFDRTRGNPLFIVETVRAGSAGDLPSKIHTVITARLAQLSEAAHEIAGVAAAIGRPFGLDLLTAAAVGSDDRTVEAVDELWQRRLLQLHDGAAYDFSHGQIREVAYAEIGPARRRLLHRRIAEALTKVGDPEASSSQVAEHYERAGMPAQAIPYYREAARVVRRRYADQEAVGHLSRALDLLRELPQTEQRDRTELGLLEAMGPPLSATKGYAAPEVGSMYRRARMLSEVLGGSENQLAVLSGSWMFHVVRGELEASRDIGIRYLHAAESESNPAFSFAGSLALGSSLFHLGQLREAGERFVSVVSYYRSDGVRPFFDLGPELGVFADSYRAHTLWLAGDAEAACAQSRRSMERSRELSHPFSIAFAFAYDAMLHQFRGDAEAVEASASQAAEICLKYGFQYYLAWTPILRGWAHSRRDPATGLAEMREGFAALTATGARLRAPYYVALMAECCLETGDLEGAASLLTIAFDEGRRNHESWIKPELERLQGDLLMARNSAAEAQTRYRESIRLAREQNMRPFELRAASRLARKAHGP